MRLIDADVPKEIILNHADEFSDVLSRSEKALLIGGGTACIDKCPTVDAVPVVRCKYCKYRKDGLYCRRRKNPVIVTNIDFCSYGERRNDDA